MNNAEQFSDLSKDLTSSIDKLEKKQHGIFFTPPTAVQMCIRSVFPYLAENPNPNPTILEPSCGSCEFVTSLRKTFVDSYITGVEYNDAIYDGIKHLGDSDPRTSIVHADFLTHTFSTSDPKYDIVIGNPPYFVMKKDAVSPCYLEYFDGRPNIFILFIIRSLSLLAPNGILCFVLPKNFLNCIYYDKTRKYISNKFTIVDIFDTGGAYLETQQDTVVLVVRNSQPEDPELSKYIICIDRYTIFGTPTSIRELTELMRETTTIDKLGFTASVGKTVWNQHKADLTDDPAETRLIYSSDIKDGVVGMEVYKNPAKKNYIRRLGGVGKVLLVNRGYGVGTYKFDFCLYDGAESYLVENHIMCINGPDDGTFEKIVRSFKDPRTKKFIDVYFNNNAINTAELAHILPIYTF